MFSRSGKQHESPFGHDAGRGGLRRLLDTLFREREILIRSDGEVRFLSVGPKSQMAACAIVVVGIIWAASAIPLTVTQKITNSTNTAQILEAKIAYEDLVAEIEEYQDTVDRARLALGRSRTLLATQIAEAEEAERRLAGAGEALAGPRAIVARSRVAMRTHVDQVDAAVAAITSDGEELESMLAKIRVDLAASDDGRTLVARARTRLQERAEGLEVRLAAVVDDNQKIGSVNNELATGLRMTTAERDGLLENRAVLRKSISALETELAALEQERQRIDTLNNELSGGLRTTTTERDELLEYRAVLRESVGSLETELAALERERQRIDTHNGELAARLGASRDEAADLAGERDSLQELVAGLDSELQLDRAETSSLKDDLREVVRGLQQVTGDAGDIGDTRLALRTGIDSLLAELSNQQAAEEVVLQRAAERSAGSIEDIEAIIAMTGLKPERLLARARVENLGQGGPFIGAAGELLSEDELGGAMLSLETNMTRWESLKDVLRAMPLALPVDYYRITSAYGYRADPVNGRRSMHQGLDMAGWMKSSVWAVAPGTVVYSGKKGRYGIVVELDHGFGIRTRYAHLNKALVEVGDTVGHRQRIALLGSSGRSTGPHLHYEVHFDGKSMNPMNFIKAGRYVFKN